MKTKKEVYPVTKKFERDTKDLVENTNQMFSLSEIQKIFAEVIGEYEHGSAEVSDCENVNIKQYSAVAHDLLLCLENWCESGEENES